MAASVEWGVYSVKATPVSATTGASSATVAIPNDSTGSIARYVLLNATGNAWVLPVVGAGGSVAAGSGILLNANNGIVLNVRGQTHIAHIQQGSAQTVNIVPLEG